MVKVTTANKDLHTTQIRELFWEYLQWANAKVNEEFGVNFNIDTLLETAMQQLDKFMPPKGRLLLGYAEEQLAGIALFEVPGAWYWGDQTDVCPSWKSKERPGSCAD